MKNLTKFSVLSCQIRRMHFLQFIKEGKSHVGLKYGRHQVIDLNHGDKTLPSTIGETLSQNRSDELLRIAER